MRRFVCGGAVLLIAALSLPHRVRAQESTTTLTPPATTLLAMPFVAQSEVLCGGAALAMVLRHQGVRGVEAEDFAHLVVDSGVGIRTTDLTAAARARGLDATPFTARRDIVRALLAAGDPVIALIEDRPGIYHYVVLLAWGDERVLFHDPAVGPHQVMGEAELLRAWEPAGYWALRTRRSAGPAPSTTPSDRTANADVASAIPGAADSSLPAPLPRSGTVIAPDIDDAEAAACNAHLRAAADAAATNDLAAAERSLEDASRACADVTLVVRERAGLRFRQQRYDDAEADALLRLARAPDDAYAWNLLGASRYVRGERDGALVAWNRIGRPSNDLTRIEGLRRTPYAVVSDAVNIGTGALVTPEALAHARRRTAALPSIGRARVDYRPVTGDTVQVDVGVLEYPLVALGAFDLAVHAARAAAEQRVLVRPANVLRVGERWRIDGTWQENRRALAFGISIPRVLGMRAVTHLDAGVRDWAFADPVAADDAAIVRETVRRATLGLSDWASAAVEWQARVGIEEWPHVGRVGSALAGGALHLHDERVVFGADLTGWWAPDHHAGRNGALRARANAVLRTSHTGDTQWLVILNGALTSTTAPRALWNGAGTGRVSGALLRAHPLLDDDGIVRSRWWAPRLAVATIELRQWLTRAGPVEIGAAAFVDGALAGGATRVSEAGARTGAHGAVDGGVGLRLRIAGGPVMRIDAAHGIGNPASALSISLGRDLP